MVMRKGFFKAAVASVIAIALVGPATAGEWQKFRFKNNRHHRHHFTRLSDTYVNVIPRVGAYSGNITVYSYPGIGTSTTFVGRVPLDAPRRIVSLKMISVDPDNENKACSMESGVCVIRP